MNLVAPDFMQEGIDNGSLQSPDQEPNSSSPRGTIPAAPRETGWNRLYQLNDQIANEFTAAYNGGWASRFFKGVGRGVASVSTGDIAEVDKNQLSAEVGTPTIKIPYNMTRTEAGLYVADQQAQQEKQQSIDSYRATYGGPGLVDRAIEFTAGMVDPVGLASFGLKPITGLGTGLLGRFSPGAAKASAEFLEKTAVGKILGGGINVGGFTAAMQPLDAALDTAEGKEYSAKTFMHNVGWGFVFGLGLGGLHAGLDAVFNGLSNSSRENLREFNKQTGGQVPIEDQMRLTPEIIKAEAQYGGQKLTMDEHAALQKRGKFSPSDQEVLDHLLERQKAAGTLRPDATQAAPLTPEENTRVEELQRLRAAAKTPQAQVDPLTVKERAEMEELSANEKKQFTPEQNSEWERLKAAKSRTAEENSVYRELRDIKDKGIQGDPADRLKFLRSLNNGVLPDAAAQELFGLLHKQKLANIKSKFDASFGDQEKQLLQILQDKKASSTPVDPDVLAAQRSQEIQDNIKQKQQPQPPEKPVEKPLEDHERDVAEQVPDKLEEYRSLMERGKATVEAVAKGVDCLIGRLNA